MPSPQPPADDRPAPDSPAANPAARTPVRPASSKAPAAQPSSPSGDGPATGQGGKPVQSTTPEDPKGHLNPSAPEDANTTPGTTTPK